MDRTPGQYAARARLPLKRASRACTRCHERKVRCDGAVTGFPCTNCRLDGNSCVLFRSRTRKDSQPPSIVKEKDISQVVQDSLLARVRPKAPYPNNPPSLGSTQGTTARQWLPYSLYSSLCATGLLYLDSAKVRYLEVNGCLHVPNRNVVMSIMHYYFMFVHPCLPLIDEGAFWRSLKSSTRNTKRIPLLLFQAMLFAASCFIPEDVSRHCGYSSLLAARNDFYRKAKTLYEARVEQDALAISQAAVLLSYFTSDQEIWANSSWLHIAIKHARMVLAHRYHSFDARNSQRALKLKRLWWCCLIRDRIISLGMRRPLHIPALDPDLHQHLLTIDDLESKSTDSLTYDNEVKRILFQIMRGLCHFVVAVTDLVNLVYPEPSRQGCDSESRQSTLCRLEETGFTLLSWELDWIELMDGECTSLHPRITLFSNLVAIYYQSARIALCNKICSVLSKSPSMEIEGLDRLENCQSEISSATGLIVNKLHQLRIVGLTEKLPISVAAYALLPQILLNMVNSSAMVPEEKREHDRTLTMLSEMRDLMGSKFCTRRVVTLISQALTLFKRCHVSTRSPTSLLQMSGHQVFTLDLRMYVILIRFIDLSLSTRKVCLEQNLGLCSPADYSFLQAAVASDTMASGAVVSDDGDFSEHPAWMEGIGDFFFGQGAQLRMPSLSPAPSSRGTSSGLVN